MSAAPVLLQVRDLKKHFPIRRGWLDEPAAVQAVDGVTFDIAAGETLGLVGESGSGKSTIGQLILRLIEPTAGEILFEGKSIAGLSSADQFAYARRVQIVFQDPYSSLNPQRTVAETLARPLKIHGLARSRADMSARIAGLLSEVGLSPPAAFMARYPHQMSGGERQRVAIARAIALRPQLIVADEAVSSLDVSIRAQLLNLLRELQTRHGLAYLFITHDLATLRHVSRRVAVMYLGRLVEIGPTEDVITRPKHPYTRALLSAIPLPDPVLSRARVPTELRGPIPSPADPPSGCRFHTRCPEARPTCAQLAPPEIVLGRQQVACLPEVAGRTERFQVANRA